MQKLGNNPPELGSKSGRGGLKYQKIELVHATLSSSSVELGHLQKKPESCPGLLVNLTMQSVK
jgi:hypothetical protein